jgi:hypothetical protein
LLDRDDVIDDRCGRDASVLLARGAQWFRRKVSLPQPPPCRRVIEAVNTSRITPTFLVVFAISLTTMVQTKTILLAPSRAARMAAGTSGEVGHMLLSFPSFLFIPSFLSFLSL